ncbi:MAG: hypothetical protein V1887_04735 [Candidatus Aenigmatarchaeota archaeon]
MSKSIPVLLVLVLAVAAVALFLKGDSMIYAIQYYNSSFSTVNLSNAAPTVEAVACTDDYSANDAQVDLNGGTTDVVICNATVNDMNGVGDLTSTVPKGRFFENPAKNSATCTPSSGASNYDCYLNNTCAWLGAKNATAQYVYCRFTVYYNAKNTSGASDIWYGQINVTDSGFLVGTMNDTIEVGDLLAIGTETPTILFGAKTAGTNDTTVGTGCGAGCKENISNQGNIRFDLLINGSNMACSGASGGTISSFYIHANLTDAALYSQSYALSTAASSASASFTDFDLSPNSTATTERPVAPGRVVWFGIGIPYGVNGNCQSMVWFTAYQG